MIWLTYILFNIYFLLIYLCSLILCIMFVPFHYIVDNQLSTITIIKDY